VARDHRRLAAIVSLDVVGYSRLMGVDESGTLAALKAHRRELIDPKIAEHDGRIVKTTGDGLLLEYTARLEALADFNAAVPGVRTVSAIKKWMHPGADLAGYEPLYEGLKLAGVPD
jgi:class 3 adenylate cyclase